MMMTEAEAKTKWCPLLRQRGTCIASACMAWRAVAPTVEQTTTDLGRTPKGDGWKQIELLTLK